MTAEFTVHINNPVGKRVLTPKNWVSVDYTLAENDATNGILILPGDYDESLFVEDGSMEFWRSVDGGPEFLDGDSVWLIRRAHWQKKVNEPSSWTVTGARQSNWLGRRTIDYQPENDYTDKLGPCDDLQKAIVRENLGYLALDSRRDLSPWLSIAPNAGRAPVRRAQTLSSLNILKALQDLSQWSADRGTYLAFDIVCTQPPGDPGRPMRFEFRTYVGQRGQDLTRSGIKIGAAYNNLDEVSDDYDWTDEITAGIATVGVGDSQARITATDIVRRGRSPFNLIESVRATTSDDSDALEGEARAELQSGLPRFQLSGKLVQTDGAVYNKDWKWGDLLPVEGKRGVVNAHASKVHVFAARDQGETVEAILTTAAPISSGAVVIT